MLFFCIQIHAETKSGLFSCAKTLVLRLQISSFSHIGYSFVRTMTMVTGEMDFDGLFHLGVPPSAYTPIPFHITNFIMWIIFLVLIPIVLGNMLVSNVITT